MTDTERKDSGGVRELGGFQLTTLVALRMLVGWHFLYEGLAKLTNPYWTSAGYLQESQGWFSDLFLSLAANPGALTIADHLNQWGLLLIGLALLVGVLVRPAALAGVVLLLLYYLAAPPFPGLEFSIPAEGSYLIVNKILIELVALLVIMAIPTSHRVGLDRWIQSRQNAESVG
jgi:thiosulfate dehydrogenase [quinone] large subunit